jgi:TonB-linked SusC/RagA family outer membrane protein
MKSRSIPPTRRRLNGLAAIAALALFLAPSLLTAQTGAVSGQVVSDRTGEPLANAQVTVVGTTLGALTDQEGQFSISGVEPGDREVRAQRIGYRSGTQQVTVSEGATASVDFVLRETALAVDEVVVTGVVDPTSARRVPFTVGRVSQDDLPVPAVNAVSSLQGKVAGVNMTTPAQPGAGVNIVLRTPTSINRGNAPLFVVDGVILASTFGRSTADLSSLDIESIEVVKGAAAASLYGSRAANGVIQIRTRRGTGLETAGTEVTARTEFGMNQLSRGIDLAQHHHYLTDQQGRYIDHDGTVVTREERVLRPASERFLDVPYADPTFNHIERFFDPGRFMVNSVSIAGSADATNFHASFGNHQVGGVILDAGGYDRNELRLNLDHRLGDNLQFGFSGYHMRSHRDDLPNETFRQLLQQAPDVDLLTPDPDGTPYIFEPDLQGVTPNPLYEIVTSRDDEARVRTLASTDLRWSATNWLRLDGNLSYDRSDRLSSFYFPRGAKTNVASWQEGVVSRGNGLTTALNASLSAQVRGSWRDISSQLTVRALTEKEDYEFFSARTDGLSVVGVPDLDAGTIQRTSGSTQEIAAQGYFAIANFDYLGRYIVDGLIRRDGSSLFGPEERWHTYYRGSAAWRMAEEPWWRIDAFDEFKLRYSIGTAGGRPSFGDRFETYGFTSGGGLVKQTLGNRFLKPERSTEQEFGIDAILGDRVSVQLSHARVVTEDQLILVPLPAGFGFSSQWQNAGTVQGNTWEGTLEAAVFNQPDLRWTVGLVADRSRHVITEFDRRCFRTGTGSAFFRCEGETLGTMYGTRFIRDHDQLPDGAPADQFQVNDDGLLVWVGQGGDWRDGQWGTSSEDLDRTYGWGLPILEVDETGTSVVSRIGDSNPAFNWGLSSNVQWRDLTVYALVNAQVGGDIYNRSKQRLYQYFHSGDTDQAGRPEELKKTTDYYTELYAANLINEWFVEPADYLKLREVSLRYRVPGAVLGRLTGETVDGLTVFASGRNLFTWSQYSGFDPEAGTPMQRIDAFVYPQYRTLTTGLEIRF